MTGKSFLYLVCFAVITLLNLLLGESYLGQFLVIALIALVLIYHQNMQWWNVGNYKIVITCWIVFLISQIFISFFTHSIPFSLYSFQFYCVSFAVFLHVLLMDKKYISSESYLLVFVLQGLVLSVLSGVFLFFPQLSTKLPGMNLFHSTYGHNHVGAYLLLVTPLAWYFAFKSSLRKVLFILPVFLTVTTLMSFGRTIIFLSCIQTLGVMVFYYTVEQNKLKKKLILSASMLLLLAFSAVMATKLFFSVASDLNPNWQCPFPTLRTQLCKSFKQEARVDYWRQSLRSFHDYPVFGYGPGTFSLISNKYRTVPYTYSSYAHNAFLQHFAEGGLIGGISFLVLMFGMFVMFLQKRSSILNKKDPMLMFILISVTSIFLNALFDFDWNFQGIFLLTVMLFALGLKVNSNEYNTSKKVIRVKFLYFFFLSVLIIFASIACLNEGFIAFKKEQIAFKIFPYFSQQKTLFLQSTQLSDEQMKRVQAIYQYDSGMYKPPFKKEELSLLYEIDKWKVYDQIPEQLLSDEVDLLTRGSILSDLADQVLSTELTASHPISEVSRDHLIDQLLVTANALYLDDQPSEASQLYVSAHTLNSWSLAFHRPAFLYESSQDSDTLKAFLSGVDEIDGQFFGDYQDDFSKAYIKLYLEEEYPSDEEALNKAIFRSLNMASWNGPLVWKIVLSREVDMLQSDRERLTRLKDSIRGLSSEPLPEDIELSQ